ncbi:Calycin [Trinorchestia longiramus]|nr:Calycin [Trinorchestia longiramus]
MHGLSVGFLIFAFTLLASVEAGFGLGRCRNQPVVNNFVFGTYAGDWYEYSRYITPGQVIGGCTKITNTLNGQLMDVEVESINL